MDTSVFLTSRAAKSGTFRGGVDAVFNLKNGGVAIGKISPRRPEGVHQDDERAQPLIISGKIKPPKSL